MSQRTDGKEIPPFIIKYEFENATKYDFATPSEELKFQAKTSIYSYENFLQTETFQSRGTTQSRSTTTGPEPCVEINTTNGSGGGGGNSDGNYSGGKYTEQTSSIGGKGGYGMYVVPIISGGGSGGSRKKIAFTMCGSAEIDYTVKFANRSLNTDIKERGSTGPGPCPEGKVLLPINKKPYRIDDSMLKPCMISIIRNIKSLTKGISHIVVKFSGSIPNYNWILTDVSLSGQTGTTDPPAFYNKATGSITTTFDSKGWPDATDLSWARTMLHESVHANLAIQFAINRPDFIANYPTMVSEWGKLQNWNDVHHQEIARSIVNDVAIALEEYGKNQGYNLTKQFYEDMSWGGLQDTSTFKSLSPTNQKRILNTISTELTGKDTNGNVKSQMGKNAGC